MLAQLTIIIIDHDGIVMVDPTTFEVELPEDRERIIDAVEAAVLRWREGATRTLTTIYLNSLSHKKALQAQASLGGQLTVNAAPFRVGGEIGRLTFPPIFQKPYGISYTRYRKAKFWDDVCNESIDVKPQRAHAILI